MQIQSQIYDLNAPIEFKRRLGVFYFISHCQIDYETTFPFRNSSKEITARKHEGERRHNLLTILDLNPYLKNLETSLQDYSLQDYKTENASRDILAAAKSK